MNQVFKSPYFWGIAGFITLAVLLDSQDQGTNEILTIGAVVVTVGVVVYVVKKQ